MSVYQWGSDERQRVYVDTNVGCDGLPWLVVIHGGAWRDPQITYKSALKCLEAARASDSFGGLCSLDYRLSPDVQHPGHVDDVIEGIRYILKRFDPSALVLLGHSCGAFMAGQVYPYFASRISKVICLEGIYSLQLLVEEYPEYAEFVEPAFGPNRITWPEVNWARVMRLKLVHSVEDELLSMRQPEWASGRAKVPIMKLQHGRHDEVYEENFDEAVLGISAPNQNVLG